MKREDWFAEPIWYDEVQIDFRTIAEKCLHLSQTLEGRRLSNVGGWQSDNLDLNDYQEFHIIRSILQDKIGEFSWDIGGNYKFELDNAWINVNYPGNYNIKHVHPVTAFSGTIYIQTNENTGKISFFKDSNRIHYPVDLDNCNLFHTNVTYTPRNGLIVIFPAWLSHAVEPNNSNQPRISISFNIKQIRN